MLKKCLIFFEFFFSDKKLIILHDDFSLEQKTGMKTMNRLKIVFNVGIFLVIIGFVWYMAASISRENFPVDGSAQETSTPFSSWYRQVESFKLPEEVNCFELYGDKLYISAGQTVYIFDTDGRKLANFPVGKDVRDITVDGEEIYLLYPTRVAVYSTDGQPTRQWEACSNLSDYCSLAVAGKAVFVTDAENKNICKYTTEGDFVKFIQSPAGFIIPSYSFDIDCWNDTVYCVNSGRHSVETYTLNGDFIASFGSPGSEAGFFAGCCNPAYISFTSGGALITSEKGNPRVSCFGRNGNFNGVLLDSKTLGGGNKAYEVKAINNKLFAAGKNKVTVFQCDKASASTCSGCAANCPLRR